MENTENEVIETDTQNVAEDTASESVEVEPVSHEEPEVVQPVAAQPKPVQKKDDTQSAEIAKLRSELRAAQLKSALADQHLVPLDKALVQRLLDERMSSDGLDVDGAVQSLYKSHPYLFQAPKAVRSPKDDAKAVEAEKSYNDRIIKSAIERIRRTPIKLD